MNVEKNIKSEAAIVTNFSYKLRDGGHVDHYRFDREGVDQDLHRISEDARLWNGKGSVLVDCPFGGIGDKLSISLSSNDHFN